MFAEVLVEERHPICLCRPSPTRGLMLGFQGSWTSPVILATRFTSGSMAGRRHCRPMECICSAARWPGPQPGSAQPFGGEEPTKVRLTDCRSSRPSATRSEARIPEAIHRPGRRPPDRRATPSAGRPDPVPVQTRPAASGADAELEDVARVTFQLQGRCLDERDVLDDPVRNVQGPAMSGGILPPGTVPADRSARPPLDFRTGA
jgi:hypothetical protein